MKFFALLISLVVCAQESELIPVIPSAQGLMADTIVKFALRNTGNDVFELFEVNKQAKTTGIVLSLTVAKNHVSFTRNDRWYVFYDPDLRQIRCYSHKQLTSFCARNKKWRSEVLAEKSLKKSSVTEQNDELMVALDNFLTAYPDQPIYSQYYPYRGDIQSLFMR